jgi:NADPH-dependent 2,4-dienoyl-CoA reductase/sulfur reductase-like enzyme
LVNAGPGPSGAPRTPGKAGPRIVLVGAGPAGTRAAETLVRQGIRLTLIDEAPASGGQIYRRPPAEAGFARARRALYGFEAGKAAALHDSFDALLGRIDYRPGTLVWEIAENRLHGHRYADGAGFSLGWDALILATGAMDRVLPIPGWTLAGVFTLGGAQIALKYQGCAVGRRTVFLGSGPLLYLAAYQYAKAGAEVAAVLDTAPFAAKTRALPKLIAGGATFAKGLFYMAALKARGVPIRHGVRPLEIEGEPESGVAAFRFETGGGRPSERIPCDAVALGWGLRSETQLADLAGCRFAWSGLDRQWLPGIDPDGRSSLQGLYLAGDGAGIAGAEAAELRGELAAWALVQDLGLEADRPRMAAIRKRLARIRRFREGLEAAFPFPAGLAAETADATILCRCEAVRAGELRATLAGIEADELNRAKAQSRVGMGRCQGRVCGAAAAEILAAALQQPVEAAGRFRGQPPVKPLPLGGLIEERGE